MAQGGSSLVDRWLTFPAAHLATEQGVLLLGDRYSPTITELVLPDGSTLGSFTLRYNVE